MFEGFIDRLFKSGIATTIIGLVIMGISLYMWMSGKATTTEALSWGGIGLLFLRSKDSLIGIPAKTEKIT